jgi:hypothetical protein
MTEGFGNGGPPWFAEPLVGRSAASTTGYSPPVLQHREVDIRHGPRGAPTPWNLFTRTTIRSGGPKVWKDSKRTFGRYEGRERWRGSTPPIGYARARESLGNGPPWFAEPLVGRSAPSTKGLHPPLRGERGMGRGGPPWLAVQHREVDVGHLGPPERQAVGSSPPIQSRRHPERSEGSARLDQILRVWETTLRMTEGFGNGGPPWLAVQHREVDIGHRPRGALTLRNLFTRTTIRSGGPKVWEDSKRTFGRYEGYERARESIARLVGRNTSNLPKVHVNAKATLGRCNATRSCASDAEHEFPRTRCPGRYPMLSFRDPRGPQLLLMQPSLLCRRDVGKKTKKAFS